MARGRRPYGILTGELEPRAWGLLEGVLTEEQLAQLRNVIDEWRARNPKVRTVAYIHFHDFAKAIGHPTPPKRRSGETCSP